MRPFLPARPRRLSLWSGVAVGLAVPAVVGTFFWAAADWNARYALRVLVHQNSQITDANWKSRLTAAPAVRPRPWITGGDCAPAALPPALREKSQSLLIVRDGRLVCEWYGNGGARDRPAAAFSISKTVLALLVSRAVADGSIPSLGMPVTDALPELRSRDGRFAAVTLADLLDMRSGIAFSERIGFPWVNRDSPAVYYATDLAATVLRRSRIQGPPGAFQYNDYAPNLVGLAALRTTGRYLVGAPLQQLWAELGSEYSAGWSVDDNGFPYHESGFIVAARDLARIGQLVLDDGRADGRQIAPRAFVERSLTGPSPAGPVETFAGVPVGYRNGWWLLPQADGGRDLAAMGAHGQVMVVSPVTGTVAVRMGDGSPLSNIEIAVALQRAADQVAG